MTIIRFNILIRPLDLLEMAQNMMDMTYKRINIKSQVASSSCSSSSASLDWLEMAQNDKHSHNMTVDHRQSTSINQSTSKLPVKDDPQNGDKRQGDREAVDSKDNGGKS